jgi:carbon storage regulator CsrA
MALILKRKEGESVVVGGGIRVTVMRSHDGGAALAFEAPEGVKIMRSELVCSSDPDGRTYGELMATQTGGQ